MDLYCQQCGASWPLENLNKAANKDRKCLDTKSTKYFLEGRGCPSCQWGQTRPRERPVRAEMMQIALEQYGNNLQMIALELYDMQQMELLGDVG